MPRGRRAPGPARACARPRAAREGEGLERNNKLTNEIGNILNESFPEWRFVGKRRIKGSSPVRSWDYVGGAER